MNPDPELERHLRSALRPQAPDHDLTAAILARTAIPAARPRPLFRWGAVLAAVCLLLLAGVAIVRQRHAAAQQAAAGRQLIQALRLAATDLSNMRLHIHDLGNGGD